MEYLTTSVPPRARRRTRTRRLGVVGTIVLTALALAVELAFGTPGVAGAAPKASVAQKAVSGRRGGNRRRGRRRGRSGGRRVADANAVAHGQFLIEAGRRFGVDANWLAGIMLCESGGNARSRTGKYHGLFQFTQGLFAAQAGNAGFPGASIYDPRAQAHTAAMLISRGQIRRWPVCGRG